MIARPAPIPGAGPRSPPLSLAMTLEGPAVLAALPATRTNHVLVFILALFGTLTIGLAAAEVFTHLTAAHRATVTVASTGATLTGDGFRVDPDAVLDVSRFDDLRARA